MGGANWIPTRFEDLLNTPGEMAGYARHLARVNAGESALEYVPLGIDCYYPETYGAVADGRFLLDGAITSGTTTFTSASNPFTADDVGKIFVVTGAGAAGGQLTTTIASYNGAGSVELTASASTTVSAANASWGTDNTAAFQDAIDAAEADGSGTVLVRNGFYLFAGVLTVPARVCLKGNVETVHVMAPRMVGSWSPLDPAYAPMLLPTNTSTEFITMDGFEGGVRDLMVFYPNQLKPNDGGTPVAYPYTIYSTNHGCNIHNFMSLNSYNGIRLKGSRHRVSHAAIGALSVGLRLEECYDFTYLNDIEMVPFWDLAYGIPPSGSPGTLLTQWCVNNGIGFDFYLADGLMGKNIGIFRRNTGMRFQEDATQNRSGWGFFANTMLDVVKFGIRMTGGDAYGEYCFSNLFVTAHVSEGGDTGIWVESGGTQTPKLHIVNGSVTGGTFSNGNLKIDNAGAKVTHHNLRNVSDTVNTFSNGDTTPSVALGGILRFNNSGATTVTNFDSGHSGQRVTIIFDGNTTINETGNIKVVGGSTITPGVDDIREFIFDGTTWREVA